MKNPTVRTKIMKLQYQRWYNTDTMNAPCINKRKCQKKRG